MSSNPTPVNSRETGATEVVASLPHTLPRSGPSKIHFCMKCAAEAKKRCVECKNHGVETYYCSRECQVSDLKKHKEICGAKHADYEFSVDNFK